MESHYMFLLNMGLILLAANIGGMISKKLKQPAVLGQILVGIILGMGLIEKTEFLTDIGEIGVIFLMFIAGLETDINELKASGKSSATIALGGVIVPAVLVFVGMYFISGYAMEPSIFLGVISTATSVSITVQTLREMKCLRSRQGITVLGAAIIDDIVGIIMLTLTIGFIMPSAGSSLVIVIGKIISFFLIVFIVSKIVIYVVEKYDRKFDMEDKIISLAIVLCFVLAFVSEELGVAAITGAYFSGVVLSVTKYRHKVAHDINKFATTLFTPIFFVGIGMGVDLFEAFSAIEIGIVLIIAGVLGKIIGGLIGARFSGFNKREAMQIGIGMVPRAEVALIIASLGVKLEIINHHVMAAVILMVIVTTLITPPMLKKAFDK